MYLDENETVELLCLLGQVMILKSCFTPSWGFETEAVLNHEIH